MSRSTPPSAERVLTVRVPASTSNLGPGFDQLGLALDLPLIVKLEGPFVRAHHELCLEGEIAQGWPTEGNRMLRAFDALWQFAHSESTQVPRFRFHVRSEIPLCRGLGSSGAATAAGLVLAARCLAADGTGGTPTSNKDLERIGAAIEGHPDNVIASLYGGCTLGVQLEDGSLRVVRPQVHDGLLFPVAWPSTPLSTETARAAMPASLSLEDVVWNTRRLGLLLEGLRTADPDLLRHGVDDRLHTPYRLPLIDGAEEALRAAYDAGAFCAAISGSGSALVAAHTAPAVAQSIANAMREVLAKRHASASCRVLALDAQGARITD